MFLNPYIPTEYKYKNQFLHTTTYEHKAWKLYVNLDIGRDCSHRSYTARSFVPYYAQRMSNAIVINGAQGILNGINKMRRDRLRRSSQA